VECSVCAGKDGYHLSTWHLFSSDLQDLIGGSGLTQETLCLVGFQTLNKGRVRDLLGWNSEGEVYANVPGGYIIPYPELGQGSVPCLELQSWDHAEPPYWRIRMRAQTTAGAKDAARKKAPRYLGPGGRPPRLFVPLISPFTEGYLSGTGELFVVEGEKKALKLTQDGIPAVCFPGIHGWLRSGDESPRERFVGPRNIWRRPVRLLYDSDITRDHKAGWPAYQRLASVLMTLGATSCDISTTPLPKEGVA
jgi:Domain of unknown function (DUF3854)